MQSPRGCVDLDVLHGFAGFEHCMDAMSLAWTTDDFEHHKMQGVAVLSACAALVMSDVDPFDMFLSIITSTRLCLCPVWDNDSTSLLCWDGGIFCAIGETSTHGRVGEEGAKASQRPAHEAKKSDQPRGLARRTRMRSRIFHGKSYVKEVWSLEQGAPTDR